MYKKNLVSGILLQLWKILYKFVFSVLVARAVGNVTYGQITYFFLVFNLLGSYGHLGIINGISYFAKTDKCDLNTQINANITYLAMNSLFIGIILCSPPIKGLVLPEVPQPYMIGGLCFMMVTYLYAALEAYFVSQEKIFKSNGSMAVGMLAAMAGMLVCLALGKINLATYLIFQIIELLVAVLFMCRSFSCSYRPQINIAFLIREFKYGHLVFWASLFGYLNYRIDQFMIQRQLGDGMLGIYSVAVTIAELVLLVPNSITAAITGKLLNSSGREDQKRVLCITIKGCVWVCLLLVVMGIVLAPIIQIVYGAEYYPSVQSFRFLLLGICGAAVGKVVYPFYLANGRAKVHMLVAAFVMLVNIGLNMWLIPDCGINGAAFASTCSYLVYGGVYIGLLVKKEGIKLTSMFLFSREEMAMIKRSVFS